MNEIGIGWWILGFFILLAWGKICNIMIDQQSEFKMMSKPQKKYQF